MNGNPCESLPPALWLAACRHWQSCRAAAAIPVPRAPRPPAPRPMRFSKTGHGTSCFSKARRVGYSHAAVYRERAIPRMCCASSAARALTLRSYGNLLRMESEYVSVETPEEQLLEFSSSLPQGGTPMRTVGRVVGDQLNCGSAPRQDARTRSPGRGTVRRRADLPARSSGSRCGRARRGPSPRSTWQATRRQPPHSARWTTRRPS